MLLTSLIVSIIVSFIISFIVPAYTQCLCPHSNPPPNVINDLSMKPHADFGVEWWYYLSNIIDPITQNQFTFVSYFVKINEKCDGTDDDLYINKVFISSPTNNWEEDAHDHLVTPSTLNLLLGNTSIRRYNNNKTIFTHPQFEIIIEDHKSFVLQGKKYDGYVPGSFSKTCDGSYSASVLHTRVTGTLNGTNIEGIGYGEHVLSALILQNDSYAPDLGWTCHYIFWNNNSIQLCQSVIESNQSNHGMLYYNDIEIWLDYMDFITYGYNEWHNFKLNWEIFITQFQIEIVIFPSWKNQETSYLNNSAWIGQIEGTISERNGNYSITGFTEIVNVVTI